MIKIYIDENISRQIASGLNILQNPLKQDITVLSIPEVFGRGSADEEWLPKIGAERAVVITQDLNIHRSRHQRALFEAYGVGILHFTSVQMRIQILGNGRDNRKTMA